MMALRLALAAWELLRARWAWLVGSWATRARLRLRGVTLGPRLRARGRMDVFVHRTADVRIGADCRLRSGFTENPVGGHRRLCIWVGRGASLTIGDRVGISSSTLVATTEVRIGDDVFIGGDCRIYDTDFHPVSAGARVDSPGHKAAAAPVIVEERAFIGAHTTILKGVTIGREAVVGACSVVTRDVPPGELWAGTPARQIGRIHE